MWTEAGEIIKAVAPVFTASAAVAAVLIGYKGLTKWQVEMLGKRKSELAEEVLSGFYQMRDIMSSIRSPNGYTGEGESRKCAANETPEMKAKLDQHFVTIERYKQHIEFFSTFRSKRYRMRALFGPSAEKAFTLMDEAVSSVITASRMLMMRVGPQLTQLDPKLSSKWDYAVWETGGENDLVAVKINEAVKLIEDVCRPILVLDGKK